MKRDLSAMVAAEAFAVGVGWIALSSPLLLVGVLMALCAARQLHRSPPLARDDAAVEAETRATPFLPSLDEHLVYWERF